LKKPLFEQEEGVKGRLHCDVYRTEFGNIGFHSHTKDQRLFAFENKTKEHLWLYVAVLYGNPNIAITVREYFPNQLQRTNLGTLGEHFGSPKYTCNLKKRIYFNKLSHTFTNY